MRVLSHAGPELGPSPASERRGTPRPWRAQPGLVYRIEVLWIGLISGTSADALDAALVEIGETPRDLALRAYLEVPLEGELRARIQALASGPCELRELARLDRELAERFADAALELLREAGVQPAGVEGIGSHGQTVGHYPEPEVRESIQLGDPAVLHERTGIPVIADFRRADLAAGGEGAPLTPFLHHLLFADRSEPRAVLNIGGFTNVSYLPGEDPSRLVAFDPGPGNALLDSAARLASSGRESFDRDGVRGRRGRIFAEALSTLLMDPYFAKPPPKSTGHEHFDSAYFELACREVARAGGAADDLLATLAELTVESVARAAESFFPVPAQRWLVYGGGARNAHLIERLRARLAPAIVEGTESHGLPGSAVEAVAFAVLGWCSARGQAGNLPAATGARHSVVLGAAVPPAAFRS